ncbi:MAG: hypothetical protein EBZ91_08470 [Gammaproteobacteria bacterium]|nr:hypothetical protein [Gammaproteobacteria bacterium]
MRSSGPLNCCRSVPPCPVSLGPSLKASCPQRKHGRKRAALLMLGLVELVMWGPQLDAKDQTSLPACSARVPSSKWDQCVGTATGPCIAKNNCIVYSGAFRGGQYHGAGTLNTGSRLRHYGEFENGLSNGPGVDIFDDYSFEVGEFRDGKLISGTTLTALHGFDVNWREGRLDILERVVSPRSDRRTGEFDGNRELRHGVGVLELAGVTVRFVENRPTEKSFVGSTIELLGSRRIGTFPYPYAALQGEGREIRFDGEQWSGVFENGLLASGVKVAADGTVRRGEFPGGSSGFVGQRTEPDGSRWNEKLENLTETSGPFTMRYEARFVRPDGVVGIVPSQTISIGQQTRQSIYLSPSGAVLAGEFRAGVLDGIGQAVFRNGERYRGQWKRGLYHGQGILFGLDGSRQKAGRWESGRFVESTDVDETAWSLPLDAAVADLIDNGKISATPARLEALRTEARSLLDKPLPDCPQGPVETRDACFGIEQPAFGAIYVGEFRRGLQDGQGLLWAPEYQYRGTFRNGKPDGQGRLNSRAGEYSGGFLQGQFHGQGRFSSPDVNYEGEYRFGKPDGFGTLTVRDGVRYRGQFLEGRYHGQGTLELPHGAVFAGKMVRGELVEGERRFDDGRVFTGKFGTAVGGGVSFSGTGKIVLPNAFSYEGEFLDSRFQGQGVFTWANGARYEGRFEKGDFHGQGRYQFVDGSAFVGSFERGMRNGEGVEFAADGSALRSGRWEQNKLISIKP